MLRLRYISGYPRREAGDFCWGELGGKSGIFAEGKLAVSQGFLLGCILNKGAYCVLLRLYCELRGYTMLYLGSHLCYRVCCVLAMWFYLSIA